MSRIARGSSRVVAASLRLLVCTLVLSAASILPLPGSSDPIVTSEAVVLQDDVAEAGFEEVVELPVDAEMVGFTWDGTAPATIEVRAQLAQGWGEWMRLEGSLMEGPDTDTVESSTRVSAGPAWLGHDVAFVQVRVVEGQAPALTAHAINSEAPQTTGGAVEVAGAATPLPSIIPRAQWGADESWRSLNCSGYPSYAPSVNFAMVHHTVNSNSYGPHDSAALIRGIYHFHTHTNGWCDIAYNFLIDRFGQVFEGRYGGINRPVIGGHASGFNTGSTGISMLGDFSVAPVPAAAYNALRRVTAWKLALHGVDPNGSTTHTVGANTSARWPEGTVVTVQNISGHSDTNQTGCPGAYLYPLLPQLRAQVAADIAAQGAGEWRCLWDQHADPGPSVVSPAAGRLDLFVRGADGQLWQKVDTGSGITGWSPLGGVLTSDPDAASWGGGRLDVFARGGDGALWHRAWTGSGWSAWSTLGGALAAAPTAVSWGPDRLDVFVCGIDGALWHRAWTGTAWTAWSSLGGLIQSAPDAASPAAGRLDVFARGVDGRLYYRTFANGTWSGWGTNDGGFSAGPGATRSGGGRIDVLGRGLDRAVYLNARGTPSSGWSGWYALGGLSASDVDVTSTLPGRLDVLIRGVDGNYWRRSWNGSQWSGWYMFG